MSSNANLLELIPDKRKLIGVSINDLLENLLDTKNSTLIFLDIETLGMNPIFEYEQITEIAATAVDSNNLQKINSIHYKIELSESANDLLENSDGIQRFNWERRQKRRGKTALLDPKEILELTNYYNNKAETTTERIAIKKLHEFLEKYNDPIIIAHNSDFDVSYIKTRSKFYSMTLKPLKVIDTLKISQFFFVPTLKTLTKDKDSIELSEKLTRKNSKTNHISSRLGDLSVAFGYSSKNWHTADADVEMLQNVYLSILKYLKQKRNTNIYVQQKKEIDGKTKRRIRKKSKK